MSSCNNNFKNSKILKKKLVSTLCWNNSTLNEDDFIYQLNKDEIESLLELGYLRNSNATIQYLSDKVMSQCENGVGFIVLRGINPDNYHRSFLKKLFFNFCSLSGEIVSQNSLKELICEVTDIKKGKMEESDIRAYKTNEALAFHTDSSDILGLFCEKNSTIGGESLVVSASTIYNEILTDYKEYLSLYYVGFFYDKRGQEIKGESPAFRNPIFTYFDNILSCRYYLSNYIIPGYEKLDLYMSDIEKKALEIFNSIAEDASNYKTFKMQDGDLVFYSNNNVLHGRKPYEDDMNTQVRMLYRVWLNPYKPRNLPKEFAKYRFGY